MGDTGLTGRKIIVDTYGGAAPHGGGAFSGKDPTKVDRSAAYAARYVAKNVVAAGLAERCQIQVAYAIGVAHPMSILVETFGTESDPGRRRSRSSCSEHFDLRPAAILRDLDLRRPIYAKTAAYGHFGRDDRDFTWERTDKADALRAAAGLGASPRLSEHVLITGGAGFIGSHLADELLARGDRVRALDPLIPQVHGDVRAARRISPPTSSSSSATCATPTRFAARSTASTAVVHLAARVGVGQSMYEIAEYTSVNSLGTAMLLEALARAAGAEARRRVEHEHLRRRALPRRATGREVEPAERTREQLARARVGLRGARAGRRRRSASGPACRRSTRSRSTTRSGACLVAGDGVRDPDRRAAALQHVRPAAGALEPVHRRARDLRGAAAERPAAARSSRTALQRRDFVSVHDVARAFAARARARRRRRARGEHRQRARA